MFNTLAISPKKANTKATVTIPIVLPITHPSFIYVYCFLFWKRFAITIYLIQLVPNTNTHLLYMDGMRGKNMVINVLLILNKRNQNDVLGYTITHIIVMKYLPTRNNSGETSYLT